MRHPTVRDAPLRKTIQSCRMRTKEWLNFYPCCEWTTVRNYNNIRSSRYESPIVLIVDTIRRFVRGTSTFRFDYLRAGTNTQLWGGLCYRTRLVCVCDWLRNSHTHTLNTPPPSRSQNPSNPSPPKNICTSIGNRSYPRNEWVRGKPTPTKYTERERENERERETKEGN